MSRIEISGYVQIVIGVLGTAATLLTASSFIDAFGMVAATGQMPHQFVGASGTIRIFSVLVLLFVFLLLVALGMGVTLSTLVKALGANHPVLVSLAAVLGVLSLAATATLAITGSSYWVAGFVGSLGLLTISIISCRDDNRHHRASIAALAFLVIFLATGAGTLIAGAASH